MDRSDKPVLGLRVGVTSTGCSGHMYQVEYAEDERPLEEVIEQDGVKICGALAMMFILALRWIMLKARCNQALFFENPNETGHCGCGESFAVLGRISNAQSNIRASCWRASGD